MNKVILLVALSLVALASCKMSEEKIRKSIIYDKKTPDVFYCPLEEHDGVNHMLVKSRPLKKLCEYNGQPLPEGYRSDCFADVDETDWACKEKKRIMKRRYPPGMEALEKYDPVPRWKRAENYIRYRF